jgi:hypothetical protein
MSTGTAIDDDPAYGGNGDGAITHHDHIWTRLRLWVDRNHDALVQQCAMHGCTSWSIATDWRRRVVFQFFLWRDRWI